MQVWQKNLYTIWFAQFLAMLGMNLVIPFLPLFVRELGVNGDEAVAKWSGLIFSAPFMFSLFFTPFWGTLGDKYGQKLMVVRAIWGLGIAQLLMGISPTVEFLFGFRMLQGAISGFIPSALALISVTSPPEKTGYSISLLQTATASGIVIGPLVGGALADLVSYRVIFLIVAALCFAAGILIIKNVKTTPNTSYDKNDFNLKTNISFALKSKKIRFALIQIFLTQTAVVAVQPIFALFIEIFQVSKSYISTMTGLTFSIMGVFMVISAPIWGKWCDKKGYKINITVATGGAALSYILQSLVNSITQVIILRALLGIFLGGILPSLYSYVSKSTEPMRRAGLIGIASSGFILANLIGPLIGGYSAAKFGLRLTFLISGLILLISSWSIFQFLKEPDWKSEKESKVYITK